MCEFRVTKMAVGICISSAAESRMKSYEVFLMIRVNDEQINASSEQTESGSRHTGRMCSLQNPHHKQIYGLLNGYLANLL